ncbi:cytochrome P450 [Mycobacterium syngnathidarum]
MQAFDPYSTEFLENPHEVFRRIREQAQVYYNEELDFYALTRYDDVAAAYRDHLTFSSAGGIDLAMVQSEQEPPQVILFMDPPDHGRMRGLVNKAFTPRAMANQREVVTDVVRTHLAAADPARFDVVSDFAAPFPVEVITRMAGVPAEFRQQVRLWSDEALRSRSGVGGAEQDAGVKSMLELFGYYYNLVGQRRVEPGDDTISTLISARMERTTGEATHLDDLEIASFAALLGGAGALTVTAAVGAAIALFSDHDDQWQRLVDDRSKVTAAIEEVLRFDGPVLYNVRCTRTEVELHGVRIPEGKPVLLCAAAANRDPRVFPEPDRFDIDRERTVQHLAFGQGIHTCLGNAMARMECAIALEHLLDLMPKYQVIWEDCRRVNSAIERGYSELPVRILS